MADITQIQVGQTIYDIRDDIARAQSLPAGGTIGQFLTKSSSTDFETEWSSLNEATTTVAGLMSAEDKQKLEEQQGSIIKSVSGNIVSFTNEIENSLLTKLKINIKPAQSGSGDPSPDNVRPITGWTGCNVVVSPTLDAQDGTTYAITWQSTAGTVYGGSLDVTMGMLTVDKAVFDLSSVSPETIATGTIYKSVRLKYGAAVLYDPNANLSAFIAEKYPVVSTINSINKLNAPDDKDIGIYIYKNNKNGSTYFYAVININDTINGNLLYPLATPVTYQLTPTQISLIMGLNNIWADTGNIELLSYWSKYSQNLIEAISNIYATKTLGTTTSPGLISIEDKIKLDDIEVGANAYSLPVASSTTLGGIKIGDNLTITDEVLSAVLPLHTHDDRYYTQTEIDDSLSTKAPLDSPLFTGTPTAPTADISTSTTQLATTGFVKQLLSTIISVSEETLYITI